MPMTPEQVAEMRAAVAQRRAEPAVAPVAEPAVVVAPVAPVAPVVAPEPVVAPMVVAPAAPAPAPAVAPVAEPAVGPAAPGFTADQRVAMTQALADLEAKKAAEAAAKQAAVAAATEAQALATQEDQAAFNALSAVEQRRTTATQEAAATMLARRTRAAVAEEERRADMTASFGKSSAEPGNAEYWGPSTAAVEAEPAAVGEAGPRVSGGLPTSTGGAILPTEAEKIMQSRGQGLAVAPILPLSYDVERAPDREAKAAAQVKFDGAKARTLEEGHRLFSLLTKKKSEPKPLRPVDLRAHKKRLEDLQSRYNQFRALYVVTLGGQEVDLKTPPPQASPTPE